MNFLTGFVLSLFVSQFANATGDLSRREYFQFRQRYAVTDIELRKIEAQAASEIILVTSQGYDQYASGLCWVYAAINVIETNYMEISGDYTNLPLSRAFMQRLTWEDRYKRLIDSGEKYLKEGGTVVDAISLIYNKTGSLEASGMYYLNDFEVMPRNYSFKPMSPPYTLDRLKKWLDQQFLPLPKTATDPYTLAPLDPNDLAIKTIGTVPWTAFGRAINGHQAGTIEQHWDPDARKGTLATYISDNDLERVIFSSLSKGRALTISWPKHEEMIYGAEFDQNNRPLLLYIMGSYGPKYTYKIAFSTALQAMMGVTAHSTSFIP